MSTSDPSKESPGCSNCCPVGGQTRNSRNLVVCIDGTSNKFGQNNTNVVKLFGQIDLSASDPKHLAYYSSGIGTRPKTWNPFGHMGRKFSDKFDMAVAWNLEEIVKDAYGWLARKYEAGDRIYLFGFSRGAYQARVLAGMIHVAGLIKTPTEKQIGMAYDHYKAMNSPDQRKRQIAGEFKKTFSWEGTRVHFIGVWDTVSSVGLIKEEVFLSTSSCAAHACHFRHALALDERRVKFLPEYFYEMNAQTDDVKTKYIGDLLDVGHPSNQSSETRGSIVDGKDVGSSGLQTLSGNMHESTVNNIAGPSMSVTQLDKTTINHRPTGSPGDIKEIWFAGTHSDVGGQSRSGNVSLLWMRREAADNGLKLCPTDVVWVPDDIDSGITDSMGFWRVLEYIPIKHQVSFSGAGKHNRRMHRSQSRRIIPGQQIHASVLYANAYEPHATLGKGLDFYLMHGKLDDTNLSTQIWETHLFDDTVAKELVRALDSQDGVAPIYLDRLLFMLRFEEGKKSLRRVDNWQTKFEDIIANPGRPSLLKLVILVAYHEAHDPQSLALKQFSPNTLDDAKKCLVEILARWSNYPNIARAAALLRFAIRHEALRSGILDGISGPFMNLVDWVIYRARIAESFIPAMDGLSSLLQCESTRDVIIKELQSKLPDRKRPGRAGLFASLRALSMLASESYNHCNLAQTGFYDTRLFHILGVEDPHHLIAALRMMLAMARIPNEGPHNTEEPRSTVESNKEEPDDVVGSHLTGQPDAEKSRNTKLQSMVPEMRFIFSRLAKRDKRLTGLLAAEILLVSCRSGELRKVNKQDARLRTNLARASFAESFHPHGTTKKQNRDENHGQFELDATRPDDQQRESSRDPGQPDPDFIKELINAVPSRISMERTAATVALLKLCESPDIRKYTCKPIVDAFFRLLMKPKWEFHSDTRARALLGAYALAICLQYDEMKELIEEGERLEKGIVRMLQRDFFDDAIGPVEGFRIFGNLMNRSEKLREKMKKVQIFEKPEEWVGRLNLRKCRKFESKEIRTRRTCLDILRFFDKGGPDADELLKTSLSHLRNPQWMDQKKGVEILFKLTQTKPGVDAIGSQIREIIEMLLPEGYVPIQQTEPKSTVSPTSGAESGGQKLSPEATIQPGNARKNAWKNILKNRKMGKPTEGGKASDGSSTTFVETPSREPSWMMGPACALLILAQNQGLRQKMRGMTQYASLKELHLSRMLVSGKDTAVWRIKTPNRSDVVKMLDKMIEVVEGGSSEESLGISFGDLIPKVKHWKRLMMLVGAGVLYVIGIPLYFVLVSPLVAVLLALQGILLAVLLACLALALAVAVAAAAICLPILLPAWLLKIVWTRYRKISLLKKLQALCRKIKCIARFLGKRDSESPRGRESQPPQGSGNAEDMTQT